MSVLVYCLLLACVIIKVSAGDWWQNAVFYQIYPRSFKDDTNDGIGDLKGVINKLDHFQELGVDAIWLSPIFKSPQVDQGYDISDYRDIDPDYGTLDDVTTLIEEAHSKNIKVILDFVPNHTSDQHEWFLKSVERDERYENYYIWHDGTTDDDGNKSPPNNWISVFKNSSWTWNEQRKQYYFHQFAPAQPDLNFRNPLVVQEMKDILVFWLDYGIDGFRVDAIPHLFELETLEDEPESGLPDYTNNDYEFLIHNYTKDQPETFDMVYQWREVIDEYTKQNGSDTRVLMTEAYTDENHTMLYYGTADGSRLGAHFTFNFNLITDLNYDSTAQDIVNAINKWLNAIPAGKTSNWVLGNHDNHRVATKFGPDNVDGFNMLNMMLPGASVTYNGEEIGQENGEVSYDQGQDPSARDPAIFEQVSRDFERTPYQWDGSINAGFNTGAKPWLPVSQKYSENNLESQKVANSSHYKVYQQLTGVKKTLESYNVEIRAIEDYVVFLRRSKDESGVTLIFNKGHEKVVVNVSEAIPGDTQLYVKSVNSAKELGKIDLNALSLEPHEALVFTSGIDALSLSILIKITFVAAYILLFK